MIDQQMITDLRRALKSSKTTELADEVSWLQKAFQAEELLAHCRIVNSTKDDEIVELKHHLATQPISHLLPTVRKAWMPISAATPKLTLLFTTLLPLRQMLV